MTPRTARADAAAPPSLRSTRGARLSYAVVAGSDGAGAGCRDRRWDANVPREIGVTSADPKRAGAR